MLSCCNQEHIVKSLHSKLGSPLHAQGQVHVAVRKLLAAYGDEVGSITTTGTLAG